MDAITLDTVRSLAQFRAERGRALSLYLDLDPSTTPTTAELDSRISSLLSRAREEAHAVELARGARSGSARTWRGSRSSSTSEFERNGARGLALFSDGPDGLWRVVELPEPVEDGLSVGEELNLAPLAPLLGRQEALVAFVGREQGLVLALRGGRLEPVAEQFDEVEGRHSQGGWSQARFQRHIEHLVQEHLKDVALRVERELRKGGSRPLVLVGTEETTASFRDQLSVEAQSAVVGVRARGGARDRRRSCSSSSRPCWTRLLPRGERDVLERWREAVAREEGRGAAGWEATLVAASDGKVACLVFSEGAAHGAVRCQECGRLDASGETCPLDGAVLEPLADGLDAAIRRVLAFGGDLVADPPPPGPRSRRRDRRAAPLLARRQLEVAAVEHVGCGDPQEGLEPRDLVVLAREIGLRRGDSLDLDELAEPRNRVEVDPDGVFPEEEEPLLLDDADDAERVVERREERRRIGNVHEVVGAEPRFRCVCAAVGDEHRRRRPWECLAELQPAAWRREVGVAVTQRLLLDGSGRVAAREGGRAVAVDRLQLDVAKHGGPGLRRRRARRADRARR